jgi:hypothetical protein
MSTVGPRRPILTLALLVLAQVLGTSVWFAPVATEDLAHRLGTERMAPFIIATQAGFVIGTLVFAFSGLADRYPASRVFAASAVLAAATNALLAVAGTVSEAVFYRLFTGICLAGIYPFGIKLVVSWFPQRTPQALGLLVGALVLGSASPWLIRAATGTAGHASAVIPASSIAAFAAAMLVWACGDGPHVKRTGGFSWAGITGALSNSNYRSALGGYLGHMAELYAFWALAPRLSAEAGFPGHGPTFGVMAMGALGCVAGGLLARSAGPARVARWSLAASAACGLAWPWAAHGPDWLSMAVLMIWGLTVVSDSPQFSALASAASPSDGVAAAMTLMVCLGFGLTIPTIDAMTRIEATHGPWVGWALAVGPIAGLALMRKKCR